MKARVAETYPDWTPPMVAGAAGTLLSFRHRMQVGDFVVYPYKPEGTLNFGRIASDYFYDSSASLHRNRRPGGVASRRYPAYRVLPSRSQ